jgi:hypothetical protein
LRPQCGVLITQRLLDRGCFLLVVWFRRQEIVLSHFGPVSIGVNSTNFFHKMLPFLMYDQNGDQDGDQDDQQAGRKLTQLNHRHRFGL